MSCAIVIYASLLIAQGPQVWLEDKAIESGVSLTWISGDTGVFNMPEIIGGGAAMLDFDN
ncbi:MAG: hypothetical protein HOC21_06070, partial [Phycisphaerae bacterium]|nr:hypothetical protein [Phycisphaerae bacterium]